MIGALWPLALVAPYIPWLPRPALGGYPWRQEIVLAILLCLTLVLVVRRAKADDRLLSFCKTEISLLLTSALFTIWIAASSMWAIHPPAAMYDSFRWAGYVIFLWLMVKVAGRPRALRGAFLVLGTVIWILGAACFIGYWGAATDQASPTGSLFRYFGGFSEVMAVAFPIFGAVALQLRRSRVAAICGATSLLAWLSTLEALERAPIIGALASMFLLAFGIVFIKGCRPRHMSRVWLLLGSLILVTTLHVASSSVAQGKTSATTRIQSISTNDPNTRIRFLFWGIAMEMFRSHPFLGVGGGNYEIAYPAARTRFTATHWGSPLVALHEEMLVQFAHNEYVQILAELGLVGIIFFLLFCATLARVFWLALTRSTRPLLALGAGSGLLAFALSSGASACSFEWTGGGLMFFFAVALVTNAAQGKESSANVPQSSKRTRVILSTALACSIVLLMSALIRGGNSVLLGSAANTRDAGSAERLYRAAMLWDPLDAPTKYSYGSWLYGMGRPKEAIPYLRYGVERGFNTSLCYSDLAAAEIESGDASAAEETLAKAASVYPKSVFVRVRHAVALAEAAKPDQASREYDDALLIDSRTARGWWQLINFGFYGAKWAAQHDANISKAGDLYPEVCILPIIAQYKRHVPSAYPPDVEKYSTLARNP